MKSRLFTSLGAALVCGGAALSQTPPRNLPAADAPGHAVVSDATQAAPVPPPSWVPGDACNPNGAAGACEPCPPAKPGHGHKKHKANCEPCPPAGVCDPCAPPTCSAADRFWFSADYLMWWVRDADIGTPLATTGPATSLGILGQPGTRVRLGNEGIDYGEINGLRAAAGVWLDRQGTRGIQVGGFLLERVSAGEVLAPPVLARPFFDATNRAENARLVNLPGFFTGRATFETTTRLWGADAGGVFRAATRPNFRADLILGYRYLDLSEEVLIGDSSSLVPGVGVGGFAGLPVGGPASSQVIDRVFTRNQFHGGQIGGSAAYGRGDWVLGVTAKVALGVSHQVVNGDGVTVVNGGGSRPGGLLVVGSNSGRREDDEFAVLPEVGVKLGYRLTNRVALTAGYDFLYLSSVARPGDQFDRVINPTQVPTSPNFGLPFGPDRPAPRHDDTDFWAHGFSVGFNVRY